MVTILIIVLLVLLLTGGGALAAAGGVAPEVKRPHHTWPFAARPQPVGAARSAQHEIHTPEKAPTWLTTRSICT